jgi:hypothetical protein
MAENAALGARRENLRRAHRLAGGPFAKSLARDGTAVVSPDEGRRLLNLKMFLPVLERGHAMTFKSGISWLGIALTAFALTQFRRFTQLRMLAK